MHIQDFRCDLDAKYLLNCVGISVTVNIFRVLRFQREHNGRYLCIWMA